MILSFLYREFVQPYRISPQEKEDAYIKELTKLMSLDSQKTKLDDETIDAIFFCGNKNSSPYRTATQEFYNIKF